MLKRMVTALLWLCAAWTFGGMLSAFAGIPSLVGPVLGVVIAAVVWWDPAGWLWAPRPSPAARRRLADLARVNVSEDAPEVRRTTETAEG